MSLGVYGSGTVPFSALFAVDMVLIVVDERVGADRTATTFDVVAQTGSKASLASGLA